MTLDATSVVSGLPAAGREVDRFGNQVAAASQKATQGLDRVRISTRDLIGSAAGLTVVAAGVAAVTQALASLPQRGIGFSSEIEVAQLGMAGILRSMTAVNGRQTEWNQALGIAGDMIGKLNDDALRTAASSQELVGVFQALLGPGLAARMTLDQIRELTVVGTNAVKSLGLNGAQVVQELRDLVQGGITTAGSSLATALGLKDEDIAKAKASSEGLFNFLMKRLQGFKDSSDAFGNTLKGSFDQLQEGATRVAADGMQPLTEAIKAAVQESAKLFVTTDASGQQQVNQQLVAGIREYAQGAATALQVGRDVAVQAWAHRDAIVALAGAYAAFRLGQWGSEAATAVRAQLDLAQASRLARVEAAATVATDAQATMSSREKVAALLAELQATQATTAAEAQAAASKVTQLAATNEAIVASRAEVVAKMEAARATMAQAQAQIQAAAAAGAQSYALATLREGTATLAAAQARHAALMAELAVLGQQQTRVSAQLAAATAAQTAAQEAAAASAGRLAAATGAAGAAAGAASLAARGFGVVVGALGGPVGIAIMAVTGLAMWLYRLKSAADDAAVTAVQIQRAEQMAASGKTPELRDVAAMEAELGRWKQKRDELMASGGSSTEWVNGAPVKSTLDSVNAGIAQLEERLGKVKAASGQASQGNQQMTLTLEGARQAWMKSNADVKTGSAIQQEYQQKLQASRNAFQQYLEVLKAQPGGASLRTLEDAQARQLENEKGLKQERDKAIKALNADAVQADKHNLDAQIEAVKQGYKLKAVATADGLDEIDSLVKRDLLSEYSAVARRREIQLGDLQSREQALRRELELTRKKKDSQKEAAALEGELVELAAQRQTLLSKSGRDQEELLVAPQLAQLKAMRDTVASTYEQIAAQEAQNAVIGKAKAAANDFTIAQLQRQRADLEATDNVIPGYIKALDDRIAAEQRLRNVVAAGEGIQIAQDWKDKQREQARKMGEDVRSTFLSGVSSLMEGDASALTSIGKSFRNAIVTSVAGAFYDATIKQSVDYFTGWLATSLRAAMGGGGGGSSGASFGLSLLSGLGSAYSGGLSGAAAAAAASSIGGSDTLGTMIGLMGLVKSAKGNVFDGAAGLRAYSSSIVDRPTIFPFAKGGIGLMGEAGTEGIFPLKRDGQGRLGVIAMGGANGPTQVTFAPVSHLYMDARADLGASMAAGQRMLAENNKRQAAELKRAGVMPE